MFVRRRRNVDGFSGHAVRQEARRADQRVMRSGKAKYAMTAAGMTG
jgi:hypothetical protein